MAKGSKHPGDSGDWKQGDTPRATVRERIDTALGVTSPEVIAAMKAEDAFMASLPIGLDHAPGRFTDRRNPPDRDHVKPWGDDRKGPRA